MTEVTQDKALQKKLVGAAVLIALAVIFLPMLFDGKKNDEPVSVQLKIPPKPVYDIPNRLDRQPVETVTVGEATEPLKTIDLSPPPPVEEPPVEVETPAAKEAVAETGKADSVKTPTEQPVVASKPEKSQKAKPAAPAKPKEKKPARVAKPKPAPKPAAAGGAGYVVQVGSFSQKANAESLTSKLVAKGFPAFVEGSSAKGKSIFRVKVGPRPTREAADDLRQRLIDKQRLEGIIVSHH